MTQLLLSVACVAVSMGCSGIGPQFRNQQLDLFVSRNDEDQCTFGSVVAGVFLTISVPLR
jgi:hypothetical protein